MSAFVDMRKLQKLYGGLGQFMLTRSFLYDTPPAALQAVMFGLIIISAEQYWEGDRIIYRAFGPEFEEVEFGALVPEYDAIINTSTYSDEEEPAYYVQWVKRNNRG
jgi:hypothetical protein